MNKLFYTAQEDILAWCNNTYKDDFVNVATHYDIIGVHFESITMEISQPIVTDKKISIQFNIENDKYKFDCRIESKNGCEYEFNHESLSLQSTLDHAQKWINENRADTTLEIISETLPEDCILEGMEYEMVARNILVILFRTKGQFRPISWEEYEIEREKDGNFTRKERPYFEKAVVYTTSVENCAQYSKKWRLK